MLKILVPPILLWAAVVAMSSSSSPNIDNLIIINGIPLNFDDYRAAVPRQMHQKADIFTKLHKLQKTISKNYYHFKKESQRRKELVTRIDYESLVNPTDYMMKVQRNFEHRISEYATAFIKFVKQKGKIYPPNWNCNQETTQNLPNCKPEKAFYNLFDEIPEDLAGRYAYIRKTMAGARRLTQTPQKAPKEVRHTGFIDMPNKRALTEATLDFDLEPEVRPDQLRAKKVAPTIPKPGAQTVPKLPQGKAPTGGQQVAQKAPQKPAAIATNKPAPKVPQKAPPKAPIQPSNKVPVKPPQPTLPKTPVNGKPAPTIPKPQPAKQPKVETPKKPQPKVVPGKVAPTVPPKLPVQLPKAPQNTAVVPGAGKNPTQPAIQVADKPKEEQKPTTPITPVANTPLVKEPSVPATPPADTSKPTTPVTPAAGETPVGAAKTETSAPPAATSASTDSPKPITSSQSTAPSAEAVIADAKSEASTRDSHPIRISFDLSLLKASLMTLYNIKGLSGAEKAEKVADRSLVWNGIKSLLSKTDSFMRRFILISNEFEDRELTFRTLLCPSHPAKFNKKNLKAFVGGVLKAKTDLMVYVDVYRDETDPTLAEGFACQKDSTGEMTIQGSMLLNLAHLSFKNINLFDSIAQFMTVVHETFHIIAFNKASKSNFRESPIEPQLSYLKDLAEVKINPLIDDAHFVSHLLPLDLMVPVARVDAVMTIFSLEYIDNISTKIVTNKEYLGTEMTNEISNFKDFFSYSCSGKETSDYKFFCSPAQKQKKPLSCSYNYIFKMECSDTIEPNGCHLNTPMSSQSCISVPSGDNYGLPFESFGSNSRCFENVKGDGIPFCLMFTVQEQPPTITIRANNQDYVCLKAGQEHQIHGAGAGFRCPDPTNFILSHKMNYCPNMCFGNGSCSNGKCHCYEGYDQKTDCEKPADNGGGSTMFVETLPISAA